MKKIVMFACISALAFSVRSETVDVPNEILPILRAAEIATDWTIPELKAGLDRLDRLYQNEMKSPEGRRRWHGAVTNTVFDTNALVKVQYHADGYAHRQSFRLASAMGIGERISAAEMKNRLKAQKKAKEEAAAKRKADRIALLQTNLTAEVSALMKRKKWPEDLATLYLKNELNTLIGEKAVDGVIRPQ